MTHAEAELIRRAEQRRASTSKPRRPPLQKHTVTINDWHPIKVNELIHPRHYMEAHRKKKQQTRWIAAYCYAVPKATGKRRITLKITLGPRQRGGDPDCYWKALLDSLTACGLLTDDNHQGVELMPVEFDRGSVKSTTIALEDIP